MTESPSLTTSISDALEGVLDADRSVIENPSGRMHLKGIGDLLFPGTCCVCGNGTYEHGYVQLGVYYEYEGEMYLCLTCLTEAAEIGGMLSLEQGVVLKDLAIKVSEQNKALRELVKGLSEKVELYESALGSVGAITIASPSVDDVAVPENDEGSIDPTEPLKPEFVKPTEVEESTGTVRTTGSDSGSGKSARKTVKSTTVGKSL